ncbi:MAG: TatD family deoxyribonuclease [Verrucomicrobiaceae bacterium]|nr:MAG: TatD family deoxyribonuclease [Verrucomicrobiaceae bacterium]
MKLCDAHCHLHFESLAPWLPEALGTAKGAGLAAAVVNGTRQEDWGQVAAFCRQENWALPAYGIHPWHAAGRGESWEKELNALLEASPAASVGEIGLDLWIEGHDLADQTVLFRRQLAIAREHCRPATVHCVRAWEPLRQCLKKEAAPEGGFLIHAFAGPENLIPFFAECGAFFSFSPSFLAARKQNRREAFRRIPRERILIETDAPDLGPPPELNPHPLTDARTEKPLNHPANLRLSLESLAAVLEFSVEETAELTTGNWHRLFGSGDSGLPK